MADERLGPEDTDHMIKVKVEIKYTMTHSKHADKPYKESRNQWTEIVNTQFPEPIELDNLNLVKQAILGIIETGGLL